MIVPSSKIRQGLPIPPRSLPQTSEQQLNAKQQNSTWRCIPCFLLSEARASILGEPVKLPSPLTIC